MRNTHPVSQQIYPFDRVGDTLVLQPRGDSVGFTMSVISNDLAHLRELLKSGQVRHLLIDLGESSYYGSMVLGDLLELAKLVQSRGGRVALCNVSPDMGKVLQMMQLNAQWEQFATRDAGLAAMASLSMGERMTGYAKPAAFVAVALVAFAVYWFFPRPNYTAIYQKELQATWDAAMQKRETATFEEWERTEKNARKLLEPILKRLKDRATREDAKRGEKFLLSAVEHYLPGMKREDNQSPYHRERVVYYLSAAKADLAGQDIPNPPWAEPKSEIVPVNHSDGSSAPAKLTDDVPDSQTQPTRAPDHESAAAQ